MKHESLLLWIYARWAVYMGGVIVLLAARVSAAAAAWAVGLSVAELGYFRLLPFISACVGAGRDGDRLRRLPPRVPTRVTLYTALGCPVCPLIKARLESLRPMMGFELRHRDVTFRPALWTSLAIRAVPVVEVGDEMAVGNLTTEEIARFISDYGFAATRRLARS